MKVTLTHKRPDDGGISTIEIDGYFSLDTFISKLDRIGVMNQKDKDFVIESMLDCSRLIVKPKDDADHIIVTFNSGREVQLIRHRKTVRIVEPTYDEVDISVAV